MFFLLQCFLRPLSLLCVVPLMIRLPQSVSVVTAAVVISLLLSLLPFFFLQAPCDLVHNRLYSLHGVVGRDANGRIPEDPTLAVVVVARAGAKITVMIEPGPTTFVSTTVISSTSISVSAIGLFRNITFGRALVQDQRHARFVRENSLPLPPLIGLCEVLRVRKVVVGDYPFVGCLPRPDLDPRQSVDVIFRGDAKGQACLQSTGQNVVVLAISGLHLPFLFLRISLLATLLPPLHVVYHTRVHTCIVV
mmetsp:Transcript_31376/g.76546  ORF Transcript_31376/g.76546 Transcript_31376/m.76546 type:complete len:249 (-) Transcript_31376:102-848(-)